MGQTSVGRLHGRLDVLQTSLPPSPSWIQDGGAGNDINQDLGYFFRSLVRWRWKMAALPLPVAILDDLICRNRKWGHPRWRPEAEGPPFSTSTSMGIEKITLYYSCRLIGNNALSEPSSFTVNLGEMMKIISCRVFDSNKKKRADRGLRTIIYRKWFRKWPLQNGDHFVSASVC